MTAMNWFRRIFFGVGGVCALLFAVMVHLPTSPRAEAGPGRPGCRIREGCSDGPFTDEIGGSWYWMRSPEEERRVVMSRFNQYCIRCHGVDGRGVWDIPDVPNFTNARWQASRTDGQIARTILQGRGAVMPPFRGALAFEEAWALARYVRTFAPGAEVSRPDFSAPEKPGPGSPAPPKSK
jgi:cbb3-type cytochrome c oxidase subunit III